MAEGLACARMQTGSPPETLKSRGADRHVKCTLQNGPRVEMLPHQNSKTRR